MPQKGWVNVGIPEEIIEVIDRVVNAQKFGYRSRADLILEGTKRLLRELGEYPSKPRFEHYNCYEDHVTLIDNQLGGKWIDIYFRNDKPFCELCEKHNCEHIGFILELPDVIEELKKHGWTVTETGKIVRRY